MIKRIFLGFLFISAQYGVVAKNLPLPSFPASFEVAEYQGKKGCVPDNVKYIFAVMENEGMSYLGKHHRMDTPRIGLHLMMLMYNSDKDYGYLMSNVGDGMDCVAQKLINLKFHKKINFKDMSLSQEIKPEHCNFEPPMLNLCGTFKQLSERLTKAGYRYDWQAKNEDGNIITMLSGTGQSWILTTHAQTGATIFTGAGKGEFKFSETP